MDNNYNCPMENLYTGATMLKNSLLAFLSTFTGHKAKYDLAFVNALADAIIAADAIPDETQRNADNEGKRYLLMRRLKAAPEALEPAEGELKLGKLRNYIEGAYDDKGYRKIMLKEAGFGDYDKAMKMNWETVREVLNKGVEFIGNKLSELTDDNNMPATFQGEFETMANEIITGVDEYLSVREEVRLITQSKIVANNAIFETVREICSDGQTLFSRNPAIRSQFTWTTILEIVTPPGAAGLRGSVKVKGSNLPMVGALIEMQTAEGTPVSFSTDAEGNYYSGNLPVGVYSFKLTKTGFATIETSVEIKTGTTSYKHFKMEAGSGTVIVREGFGLGIGMIENVNTSGIEGNDEDIWATLEALGTQIEYFASDSPTGEATGGIVTVNMGVPVELKVSVLKALIGVGGANEYLNAKNSGPMLGGWRVTFRLP